MPSRTEISLPASRQEMSILPVRVCTDGNSQLRARKRAAMRRDAQSFSTKLGTHAQAARVKLSPGVGTKKLSVRKRNRH